MDFNNTCIRCGKPCPEGEFMCAACNEWLEQQEGLPTMEEATAIRAPRSLPAALHRSTISPWLKSMAVERNMIRTYSRSPQK